jgi:hypothetical protein
VRRDVLVAIALGLCCLFVFRRGLAHDTGDSRYTLLLAENLLRHGDVALERYHLPDPDYRIQDVGGHRYYYFPPGSSVLSVPYVALMHARGASVVRPDGGYDYLAEAEWSAKLAAILMAAFAAVVYLTSRLRLPVPESAAIAAVAALGTQVLSTASREMWSDTWGILLVGVSVFLLLRSSVRGTWLALPLVASLEAIAYVVRPTNSLALLGTGLYVAIVRRRDLWKFCLVAFAWLVLFVAYSSHHFHRWLPDYFAASRLAYSKLPVALLGNLVSPSRGLLVDVPAVVAIAVLLLRFRRTLRDRALALLAAFVVATHLIMLGGFNHWWGGHCYGARLTAGLVPWFALLAILAVDAARRAPSRGPGLLADRAVAVLAGVLCLASIGINAVGPFFIEAAEWNFTPRNVDLAPERLWSWRHPQFLSPWVEPSGDYPALPGDGLELASEAALQHVGVGWAFADATFRWTLGRCGSTLRFALPEGQPGVLELELRPYLAGGKLPRQRVAVSLNDEELAQLDLTTEEFAVVRLRVPSRAARARNLLRLRFPDAASPASAEGSRDRRRLGAAVRAIRWRAADD